jgi:hypothetical protein
MLLPVGVLTGLLLPPHNFGARDYGSPLRGDDNEEKREHVAR